MEVGYPYAWWERLLALERLVKALAKVRFNAESLQYEDAHPHETLFRRIIALVDSIVQHQYDKVVSSVSINDEGAEAFVALQSFPKEHNHFRCPGQ
jgi:hypothetical protein